VFNLVGKRYLFLLISLLVIVPGVISLAFKGLNVGIDFVGGTTIEFRPQTAITATQMSNILKSFKLTDVQVNIGSDNTVKANETVWIRLNRLVDNNVENSIVKTLKDAYGNGLSVKFYNLPLNPQATVAVVTGFQQGVSTKADTKNPKDIYTVPYIEQLLKNLPKTTKTDLNGNSAATPTSGSTATPTSSPTSTTKGTATPAASPTTTKGTATPAASPTTTKGTATPTASPTATPAPTFSVTLADTPRVGSTTSTINIITGSVVDSATLNSIQAATYNSTHSYLEVLDNASVTGSVASETTRNAVLAVIAASLFILLYISFAFRKVAKPWRYGACAIIALLHDVLVVLGVFSILGWLFHIQIDSLFITALLTVVGFSVHDTIVVFDRIRENMQRRTTETFEQVVNASLVQTMTRSLNTSLTVLVTLTALTIFVTTGSVHNFTLALLVGIFSGTYSSIFNASMLLVIWEKGELGFGRFRREYTRDGRPVRSRKRDQERELVRTR
jgi:preprotein translocase SecF subunit